MRKTYFLVALESETELTAKDIKTLEDAIASVIADFDIAHPIEISTALRSVGVDHRPEYDC